MQSYRRSRIQPSAADRHPCCGSIYIIVVGTSLLVSLLGLSALLQQQVNRRAYQGTFDAVQARNNAFTALRVGVLLIQNDPDWRFTYPDGVWELDTALSNGTYTLEGTDPSDNDLADNPTEPVLLTGIGRYGDVTHKTQITLVPANRGFTCLEAAIHANVDAIITAGATLNNDQIVSANNDVDATTASVNCDAEAVSAITGSTYNGTSTTGITTRTMPDVDGVFNYYLANGTAIDKNSLPLGYSNVIKNPGIETGTTDWSGLGCTITQSLAEFYGGSASLLVAERCNVLQNPGAESGTTGWDEPGCEVKQKTEDPDPYAGSASLEVSERSSKRKGPQQVVTSLVADGVTYQTSVWIKSTASSDQHFRISLRIVSSREGTQWFHSGTKPIRDSDGWVHLVESLTPTWSGTLTSAKWRITQASGPLDDDYYIDEAVFKVLDPTVDAG